MNISKEALMHITEINEVVKASPAIQIQSKITHLQRRVWNVLLANAYEELPDTDIHRINVADLAHSLGFNSNNEEYLIETLIALVDCIVEWNVLDKDKKEKWGVASLLASAEIENGICTYGFAPHLRYKLYNPRLYTKLNLRLQNKFKSRYAMVLWEVCFDYFDIARNEGETPFITIETFRQLMGIEQEEYSVFKTLNRDVIKPAIKEINQLTSFFVDVEQKRIGRKIGELKFRISRMKDLPTLEPIQETVEPMQKSLFVDIDELPPLAVKLVQSGVTQKEALKIANQEWNVVDPAVLPEDRKDFAAYVEEKIEIARQDTNVKNAGGFIIKAIQENYQNPELQKRIQAKKKKEKKNLLDSLKSEMYEKQNVLLRQAVRSNPKLLELAAEKITSSFIKDRLADYDSIKDAYDAGAIITAEINSILSKEFCADLIAPVIATYEAEVERLEKIR